MQKQFRLFEQKQVRWRSRALASLILAPLQFHVGPENCKRNGTFQPVTLRRDWAFYSVVGPHLGTAENCLHLRRRDANVKPDLREVILNVAFDDGLDLLHRSQSVIAHSALVINYSVERLIQDAERLLSISEFWRYCIQQNT